ncbi:HAD hydrolase family protein [Geitlerinema sp. PCC 9228]|uniref:KdsC family phosphatase n=1 Tax=Geitlerinema sp. PCC 9228 TaxID=111611 RepID=UPI0008F99802|nr:HAD hydrolase family protein [Geitlerinema sp. PCC 9228]
MTRIVPTDLQPNFARVQLLVLDVDGVLTDGGLYYTASGEEFKKFNVKDGMGIKLILKAGIQAAIITASEAPATRHRAQKLGIQHVRVGVEDKLTALKELCQKLELDLSQVAYMGDDINDLPPMRAVGCPLTVADAMPANRAVAIYITEKSGGDGAVREICNLLLSLHGKT